jgi:hypothetical protein
MYSEEAYKPESKYWKYYDNVADLLRFGRVKLSFFHYGPLTESSFGVHGKGAFDFKNIADQGRDLRGNIDFMKDAVKHGLKLEPVERYARAKKTGEKLTEKATKFLSKGVIDKLSETKIAKGINKLAASQAYLFEEYHPNLKATAWKSLTDRVIEKANAEGKPLMPEQISEVKNKMADLTNNMFGGQNWEVQRFFNDPEYKKFLRRVIAYPDWTTSAIRHAGSAFAPGVKGEVARRAWFKYGVGTLAIHTALKTIFGGLKQNDKDGSIGGIEWDPEKAKQEIVNPDPGEWWKFPLPDVPLKIAGIDFNPGRDEKGAKLYAHFGKHALENVGWVKHPDVTLFNKLNPLLSMALKQVIGATPTERGAFSVRGKWKKGEKERLPWDATKPYTAGRMLSRGSEILSDVEPFAMKTLFEKGVSPYLSTGLGSLPISKGTTVYKAKPMLEEAFKKRDNKMVNRIATALRDNGFEPKQIHNVVREAAKSAGKYVKPEKYVRPKHIKQKDALPLLIDAFKKQDKPSLDIIVDKLRKNGYTPKQLKGIVAKAVQKITHKTNKGDIIIGLTKKLINKKINRKAKELEELDNIKS